MTLTLDSFLIEEENTNNINCDNLHINFNLNEYKEKYFNKIISIIIYKLSSNHYKIIFAERINNKLNISNCFPDKGYITHQKYNYLLSILPNHINYEFNITYEELINKLTDMCKRHYLTYPGNNSELNINTDIIEEDEVEN